MLTPNLYFRHILLKMARGYLLIGRIHIQIRAKARCSELQSTVP